MLRTPVVVVVGPRDSGKTLLIELLVQRLRQEGVRVLTCKHIAHRDFTIDTSGKDTYRLRQASGAVLYYADSGELGLILSQVQEEQILTLVQSLAQTLSYDLVIAEGFSRVLGKVPEVAKIVCVRDPDDLSQVELEGPQIVCTLGNVQGAVKIPDQLDLVLIFVKKYMQVMQILRMLGGRACGECGYRNCLELAQAVIAGREDVSRCIYTRTRREVELLVNNVDVKLNPFVSRLLKNLVKAFVTSLRDVPEDVREVSIRIRYD